MATKKSRKRTTERQWHQPWPTVVASLVAVLALGLNGYQYLSNRGLNEATTAKAEHEVSVGMEIRYLVVGGLKIGLNTTDLTAGGQQPRLLDNRVLHGLRQFSERLDNGGSPLVHSQGATKAHGAVVLRIRNTGPANAKSVVLTLRRRDFPAQGEDASAPWMLHVAQWKEEAVRLADLAPSQEVLVPLMHLVGSTRYLGTAYVPVELTWLNATTGKSESVHVQSMAPEDQWITEGQLDISVAQ